MSLRLEHFLVAQGAWFYAVALVLPAVIVRLAPMKDHLRACGAVVGWSAFFITGCCAGGFFFAKAVIARKQLAA